MATKCVLPERRPPEQNGVSSHQNNLGILHELAENRKLANSVNDFSLAELTEIINNLGLIEKSPLLWEEYVNKCLMISMKSEICFNEKNSAFNDYYESWLPMGELKLLMLRWLPDSFRKYYSRRKSVNAKAAIKNSTKL